MTDNVINFEEAAKKLEEKGPELDLQARKREALKNLPHYRGEVESKNNIRHLPDVNPGDIFWVNMDGKAYLVAEKLGKKITIKALDETATLSTGMTVFDMNKRLVSKEPLFDFTNEEAVLKLRARLATFLMEDTKDSYYLMYGRDIHYVTVFDTNREKGIREDALDIILDSIKNVGNLISMDFNTSDGECSVEIWIRTTNSKAELLYLFPYDKGMVSLV